MSQKDRDLRNLIRSRTPYAGLPLRCYQTPKIADFLGEQVTVASERLMGLVLTAMAIETPLAGLQAFVLSLKGAVSLQPPSGSGPG